MPNNLKPVVFHGLPQELHSLFKRPDNSPKFQMDVATKAVLKFPLVHEGQFVLIEGHSKAETVELKFLEPRTNKTAKFLEFFANGSVSRCPNEHIENVWGNLAYGNNGDAEIWAEILNKVLLYDFLTMSLKEYGGNIYCDYTHPRETPRINAPPENEENPIDTANSKPFKFYKAQENDEGILRCGDEFSHSAMVQMDEKPPVIKSCWICGFERRRKMPMEISHLVRHSLRHNLSFDENLLMNLERISSEAYFADVRQMFGVLDFLAIEHRDSMANVLYCCGNCNHDLDIMGMFVQLWDNGSDWENDQYFDKKDSDKPDDFPTGRFCYWEYKTVGGQDSVGKLEYVFVDAGFKKNSSLIWEVLTKVPLYKKFFNLHKAYSLAALLSKNGIKMEGSSEVPVVQPSTTRQSSPPKRHQEDNNEGGNQQGDREEMKKTRRFSRSGNNFESPKEFSKFQADERENMTHLRNINSIFRDAFLASEQDLSGFEEL